MKPDSEMVEGREAFRRFDALMGAVIKVPHAVIQERIEEQRKQSAENPNRRGPKPKARRKKA
jgi:hypothetical protein